MAGLCFRVFINRILLILLALPIQAWPAVILDIQNNQLYGATGVVVNGREYDVSFTDGIFSNVYDITRPDVDIPRADITSSSVDLYTQALLEQVFTGLYDINPIRTNGCGDPNICIIAVPYNFGSTMVFEGDAWNWADESKDMFDQRGWDITSDTVKDIHRTFAVFSEGIPVAVTVVPEPSTNSLFLIGLVAVFFFRRSYAYV